VRSPTLASSAAWAVVKSSGVIVSGVLFIGRPLAQPPGIDRVELVANASDRLTVKQSESAR